jgi:hypothetical protein
LGSVNVTIMMYTGPSPMAGLEISHPDAAPRATEAANMNAMKPRQRSVLDSRNSFTRPTFCSLL